MAAQAETAGSHGATEAPPRVEPSAAWGKGATGLALATAAGTSVAAAAMAEAAVAIRTRVATAETVVISPPRLLTIERSIPDARRRGNRVFPYDLRLHSLGLLKHSRYLVACTACPPPPRFRLRRLFAERRLWPIFPIDRGA